MGWLAPRRKRGGSGEGRPGAAACLREASEGIGLRLPGDCSCVQPSEWPGDCQRGAGGARALRKVTLGCPRHTRPRPARPSAGCVTLALRKAAPTGGPEYARTRLSPPQTGHVWNSTLALASRCDCPFVARAVAEPFLLLRRAGAREVAVTPVRSGVCGVIATTRCLVGGGADVNGASVPIAHAICPSPNEPTLTECRAMTSSAASGGTSASFVGVRLALQCDAVASRATSGRGDA